MKVQKIIKLELEGPEVDTLKGICELARRYFDAKKARLQGAAPGELCSTTIAEYDVRETKRIWELATEILNA